MSGVFMDGGSSTIMDGGSSSFMDGGTIDSTSYLNGGGGEGYLHVHTGEGINHAPMMENANHFDHRVTGGPPGSNSGFLAHLLGLDQQQTQAPGTNQQQGRPSLVQTLQFADLTHGLQISPGFGMLLVFLGFIGWLFVVYFVRHHEPMADQVLGNVPPAASVYYDRGLMNQISHAMQLRMSPNSGTVYEPLPNGQLSTVDAMKHPPQEQTRYTPSRFNTSSYAQFAGGYSGDMTPQVGLMAPTNPSLQLADSNQHYAQPMFVPSQPSSFAAPGFAGSFDGYNMAVMQTPTGSRLKSFVTH